jgi:hypothetical protein
MSTTIQVINRTFLSSPIQILTQANTAPTNPVIQDVSPWVPSGALWYWIGCPLARAYANLSSGTIDMAWVARLPQYPNENLDLFLQIAMQNQIPGSFQEASGKTVCIPNLDNVLKFIWLTQCPNEHDYYDSAQLTLQLLGWEVPHA